MGKRPQAGNSVVALRDRQGPAAHVVLKYGIECSPRSVPYTSSGDRGGIALGDLPGVSLTPEGHNDPQRHRDRFLAFGNCASFRGDRPPRSNAAPTSVSKNLDVLYVRIRSTGATAGSDRVGAPEHSSVVWWARSSLHAWHELVIAYEVPGHG